MTRKRIFPETNKLKKAIQRKEDQPTSQNRRKTNLEKTRKDQQPETTAQKRTKGNGRNRTKDRLSALQPRQKQRDPRNPVQRRQNHGNNNY